MAHRLCKRRRWNNKRRYTHLYQYVTSLGSYLEEAVLQIASWMLLMIATRVTIASVLSPSEERHGARQRALHSRRYGVSLSRSLSIVSLAWRVLDACLTRPWRVSILLTLLKCIHSRLRHLDASSCTTIYRFSAQKITRSCNISLTKIDRESIGKYGYWEARKKNTHTKNRVSGVASESRRCPLDTCLSTDDSECTRPGGQTVLDPKRFFPIYRAKRYYNNTYL